MRIPERATRATVCRCVAKRTAQHRFPERAPASTDASGKSSTRGDMKRIVEREKGGERARKQRDERAEKVGERKRDREKDQQTHGGGHEKQTLCDLRFQEKNKWTIANGSGHTARERETSSSLSPKRVSPSRNPDGQIVFPSRVGIESTKADLFVHRPKLFPGAGRFSLGSATRNKGKQKQKTKRNQTEKNRMRKSLTHLRPRARNVLFAVCVRALALHGAAVAGGKDRGHRGLHVAPDAEAAAA